MAFSTLDAALPEDLVDSIARIVHKGNMVNVLPGLNSPLRNTDTSDFVQNLRIKYPNMKVYKDDDLYWFTALLFLDDTHVIVFHAYYDNPSHAEVSICDATLHGDTFHVGCFVGVEGDDNPLQSDYLVKNKIPVEFVTDTMGKKFSVTVSKTATTAQPVIDDWIELEEAFRMA